MRYPVNIHTNNFTKEPKNVKYDQTDKYRLVADKHTFIILKVFLRSSNACVRLKLSRAQRLVNFRAHCNIAFLFNITCHHVNNGTEYYSSVFY